MSSRRFVVVVSGDRSKAVPPVFSDEGRQQLIALGVKMQKRLVELIPGGTLVQAEGVGHNIHNEKPEALLKPLVQMVSAVRAERSNLISTAEPSSPATSGCQPVARGRVGVSVPPPVATVRWSRRCSECRRSWLRRSSCPAGQ